MRNNNLLSTLLLSFLASSKPNIFGHKIILVLDIQGHQCLLLVQEALQHTNWTLDKSLTKSNKRMLFHQQDHNAIDQRLRQWRQLWVEKPNPGYPNSISIGAHARPHRLFMNLKIVVFDFHFRSKGRFGWNLWTERERWKQPCTLSQQFTRWNLF